MDKVLRPKDDAARQRSLAERAAQVASLTTVTADQLAAAEAARAEAQAEKTAEYHNANRKAKRHAERYRSTDR